MKPWWRCWRRMDVGSSLADRSSASTRLYRSLRSLSFDAMDEEEDNLAFTSTFPPPPPHHAQFTAANLALLALVRAAHPSPSRPDKGKQREALVSAGEDEAALPEWDLVAELEEPRVDWIEEDGGYECFGDFYPVRFVLLLDSR